MPVKRLTEEGIARLKAPAGKQVDYRDAGMPGLVLRVNYGGAKIWRAAHRKPGKDGNRYESAVKIGRWPHLGVAEARDKARRVLADLADPAKAADETTFGQVIESYLARHAKGLRTARFIEWALRKYVLPHWEHKRFASIRRSDIKTLRDGIESQRQGDLVLSYIRVMMNEYAKDHDDYVSPIVRGMGRYKIADHRRSRVLGDDEIRALWKVASQLGAFGALCQFLLLTAQRLGVALAMTWDQVVDGAWVIPKLDRAKGTGEVLTLPKLALEIIAAQPRLRAEPRVFLAGGVAVHKKAIDQLMRAELGDLPPWRIHDLRRSARSLMARVGVPRDHAEMVLGHRVGSQVMQTYDRYSYRDEKAAALRALARGVARIVAGKPVVRLRGGG
jgi:integrase